MSKLTIDREVIEKALEWVEAQPEPRMLGSAKIITSLREALAQPQPVQPLTEREIILMNGMIYVHLNKAERCDAMKNRTAAEISKGWEMERVELLRKLKAAHGITKGEQ